MEDVARGISRASQIDTSALMALAKRSAISVSRAAQSSKDSIDIRVTQHSDGVRVSIVGPNASRYKVMMSRLLGSQMADVKADIRTRIIKRSA